MERTKIMKWEDFYKKFCLNGCDHHCIKPEAQFAPFDHTLKKFPRLPDIDKPFCIAYGLHMDYVQRIVETSILDSPFKDEKPYCDRYHHKGIS